MITEIEIDKYEGHTKGDDEVGWRINNNFVSNGKCPNDRYIAYVQIGVREDDGKIMEFSDADANLIADAPLLLEHVKCLTKTLELIGKNMPYDSWMHNLIKDVIGYEKWQAKEMIE
jgi:hypothetical protein